MAQFDQELRIADVYAEALFDLAAEAGRIPEVRDELDELVSLLKRAPDFEKFLTSRMLEAEGRAAGLEKMFRHRLSDLVLHTLLVMNRHGRCGLLKALRRRFVLRQEGAANEVEVTVTSAVKLGRSERTEVEAIAAEISGKRPLVEYVVDSRILGGLILQVGELRLDNSVRQHLRTVQTQLFERADRGLEMRAG